MSKTYRKKLTPRDNILMDRVEHGLQKWQKVSGYNRWSLVETAMFRYKNIVGLSVRARTSANQSADIKLACHVLNRINTLGMANSKKIVNI